MTALLIVMGLIIIGLQLVQLRMLMRIRESARPAGRSRILSRQRTIGRAE
jgi:hypothetical protein